MVGPWVPRWIHGSHLATGRPYFSNTAFWLGILGNLACPLDNLYGFDLESPNLQQMIMHFGILSDSEKWHSTSLLYTVLGPPRGVTCSKHALVFCKYYGKSPLEGCPEHHVMIADGSVVTTTREAIM